MSFLVFRSHVAAKAGQPQTKPPRLDHTLEDILFS